MKDQFAFPAIPSVSSPLSIPPGKENGQAIPFLVPQIGEDGNELAGVRLPEIAVPLATYTGWNFRNPKIGGTTNLAPLLGSTIPFARTSSLRKAAGDPRLSIEERYSGRPQDLEAAHNWANQLVNDRLLLERDLPQVMQSASDGWEYFVGNK